MEIGRCDFPSRIFDMKGNSHLLLAASLIVYFLFVFESLASFIMLGFRNIRVRLVVFSTLSRSLTPGSLHNDRIRPCARCSINHTTQLHWRAVPRRWIASVGPLWPGGWQTPWGRRVCHKGAALCPSSALKHTSWCPWKMQANFVTGEIFFNIWQEG